MPKKMPKLPALAGGGKSPVVIDNESKLDLWGEVERADRLAKKILEDPQYRDDIGLPNETAMNMFKRILQFLGALSAMGFILDGSRFEQYAALHELGSLLKGPLGEATLGGVDEEISVVFRNQEKWSKEKPDA